MQIVGNKNLSRKASDEAATAAEAEQCCNESRCLMSTSSATDDDDDDDAQAIYKLSVSVGGARPRTGWAG